MAEETKDSTKNYVLKPGMKHSYIDAKGNRQDVVGDGKVTIPLTDDQAINFKDKVVRKNDSDVTQDAVTATETGLPKDGASSGASAASQGKPEQASKEDAKVVEAAKGEDQAGSSGAKK